MRIRNCAALLAGRSASPALAIALTAGALAVPASGLAAESFDGFQIYSPTIVKGETELEFREFYFADNRRAVDETNSGRIGIGHAFTDYWATEVYGVYESVPGESPEYEIEWENRFQLTPQGKYWADVGALVELERANPDEGDEPFGVRYGLLLEKQVSRWVGTANLLLENQFGPNAEDETEFQYVARLKYRLSQRFEPDIEFFGAPGEIGGEGFEDSDEQQHQAGPGFAGKAALGGTAALKYSAALLFGLTQASPDVTPVVRMEYEFY